MHHELRIVYRTTGNGDQERRFVELHEDRNGESTMPMVWDVSRSPFIVKEARCEVTMAFVNWLNRV